MASTTPNQGRRLREFLKEQQEPFILDVYLMEKGCQKNIQKSYGNSRCSASNNSGKISKRSAGYGMKQKVKGVFMYSKWLKSIYIRLIFIDKNQRVGKSDRQARSSSIASVTCTDQTEDIKNERLEKANAEKHIPRKFVEDRKQFSPVSVLAEIPSHEDSSLDLTQKNYGNQQDKHLCTPSRSARKKVTESYFQQLQEHVMPNRGLKQYKQLLLDCVREVLDTHRQRKRVQRDNQEYLSCEDIGKLISESIITRGRKTKDDKNSSQLIDFDVLDSKVRWHCFDTEKKEVAFDIGDCLSKEIIDDIVTDLISLILASSP